MSHADDLFRQAFDALSEFTGASTFRMGGQTYAGIADALALKEDAEDAGFIPDDAVAFVVRRSYFSSRPEVGTDVEYKGRALRISQVDEDEITYTLRLREKA